MRRLAATLVWAGGCELLDLATAALDDEVTGLIEMAERWDGN